MKSRYKILGFTFTITSVFLISSCYRNTPPAAANKTIYPETVGYERITIQHTAQNDPLSATDDSMKFTPLEADERFAYSFKATVDNTGRPWRGMAMYAVRNNDIENTVELFIWKKIEWSSIQFTGDLKKVFFFEPAQSVGGVYDGICNLYMADGLTGKIKLLTNIGYSPYRASKDGRFVCYGFVPYRKDSKDISREPINIILFDVEKEVIVENIEWNPVIPDVYGYIGCTIGRSDSHFDIYRTAEGGVIVAAAKLDPETMKFEELWDLSPDARPFPLPVIEDIWKDDVRSQRESVRLPDDNG
jgi:hypothetical protein